MSQQGYPPPQGYGPPPGYGAPPGGTPDAGAFQLGQVANEIKSQATASLIVGIIGFFCFGIILGPFAIYRGWKAKSLIQQYNVGQEHATKAQIGFILGIIVTALWFIGLPLRFIAMR